MNDLLWVGAGGFVGAVCRFGAVNWIGAKFRARIPAGTLFVNLLGAFLLGVLYGVTSDVRLTLLIGTGFMGAFTTFSTMEYELMQFSSLKKWRELAVYTLISIICGLLLFWLGWKLGEFFH